MLIKDFVFEEKLKPCPFCGGQAETNYGRFDYNYFGVHCNNCDAYVSDCDSEGAIEKWNRRIDEE